ncbi:MULTISPECIES: glycosyltransferase family 4 protein [Cytobacillus]|uniref:Glycosyltransferase family 4 protein n=1 Tax=Cytobacillus stercorigallinarum TaxID=2762240 RepID=A0ABR8QK04_9BACI|nr:glycosyltransferase family 4 protein [Cytobacillus stercorigallinarum]MBD7935856.1 glycosyltransferase family 4 protein [Cytobacillus stercorigallinarum]
MTESILLLTWEYPPYIVGGLGRHVSELAKSLAQEKVSVHVLTVKRQTIDEAFEVQNNVVIHRVAPLMRTDSFLHWVASVNLAMEEKAREVIKENGIDLIHAHDWIVAACSIILKKAMDIPLIATIHSTEAGRHNGIYTERQSFIDRQEKLLMASADHLVVCSHFMKNELLYKYEQPSSTLSIIPNGVSEPMKKDKNLHSHFTQDRPYLFSMGRMVEEKGFDILIVLAERLKKKNTNLKIIIAGQGPLLSYYRQKVHAKQIDEWIQFIGFVNDDERDIWMEYASLAIFPSLYEPFGMVALEAMAAGLPVLLAKTGGLIEIIIENESGLFFDPVDVVNLEKKIDCLLSKPNFRNQIVSAAQKRIKTEFSWGTVAKQTLKVYRNNGLVNKFQKKR